MKRLRPLQQNNPPPIDLRPRMSVYLCVFVNVNDNKSRLVVWYWWLLLRPVYDTDVFLQRLSSWLRE